MNQNQLGNRVAAMSRSPWVSIVVGVFCILWGAVSGNPLLLLLAVCMFYLAWLVRRANARLASGDLTAWRRTPTWFQRVLPMAVAIGAALGGLQAYVQFRFVGWSRVAAGVTAAVIAVGCGLGAWLLARWARRRADSAVSRARSGGYNA